jgi:hypothetical protein
MGDEIGNLQDRQVWGGERIAPIDPRWGNNLNAAAQFGLSGPGRQMMDQTWGAGRQGLAGIGAGMDYLGQMQGRGPNQFGFDQGTYDTIMGNLAPGVQNMFDVGARDIQQGYDFNVLPGLNMNAGLAGGYGGTKALQQSALGQAQTAGNIQNMGANLWQNAANQATQGGMTGGLQNLGSANAFDQNMLSNYGRFGALGGNLMNQAHSMGVGNIGLGQRSGAQMMDWRQDIIDANKGRYDFEQAAPWMAAGNMMDLINSYRMQGMPQRVGNSWMDALDQAVDIGTGFASAWPFDSGDADTKNTVSY